MQVILGGATNIAGHLTHPFEDRSAAVDDHVMLPERDVHVLGISVQDGLKLVISGGLAAPAPASQRDALSRRDGAAS